MIQNIPLTIQNLLPDFINSALLEDVGSGDYSTLSCIDLKSVSSAKLIIKEDGILAGVDFAEFIFHFVDEQIEFHRLLNDGQKVQKGQIAFNVKGSTHSILKLERLVLNCMQRMSGIATQTAKFTQALEGTSTKILDTRKTTPNFRFIEKWAVRIGGGINHRIGLYDMIMLKDNHIDAAGGIINAVHKCKEYLTANHLDLKIEVETRNLEEVAQAIESKVDRIMLDNFNTDLISQAVNIINKQSEVEVSGGVTLDNIKNYALPGVDFISTSQITHSVKSLDLSLKIFKD